MDAFIGAAKQAAIAPVTAALAWVLARLLHKPVVTAPIIGASRPEQLDDSLKAADAPLDPAFKRHLDEISIDYRRGDSLR